MTIPFETIILDHVFRKVRELPPPPPGKHYAPVGAVYGYNETENCWDIKLTLALKDDAD